LEKGKRTSFWKFILKCLLSGTALFIVFRNIDRQQFIHFFFRADPVWLLSALLLYNLSKIFSAFRLNYFFRDAATRLSEKDNLILYYIGMFYNLFLPGGIGGDGYKVYLVNRDLNTPLKSAIQAVLFVRLSGMVALAALSFLFGWMAFPEIPYHNLGLIAVVLSLPAWYLANVWLAKGFLASFWKTSLLSFAVQIIQVLCAWAILASLGIADFTSAYLTVFLVSSLVSVLPISIGGIGIRELVFIAAAGFCPIDKSEAVAFSFLFFLVTAVSSLPGGFLPVPLFRKSSS
jgi:uncharacterized membrane protein YbhN (UPF0104 family)